MAKKANMEEVRKRMRGQMLEKVQEDIEARDWADIDARGKKPKKMIDMAYDDAFARIERRSDANMLTPEEGNATRKRLKRLYGAK